MRKLERWGSDLQVAVIPLSSFCLTYFFHLHVI